MAVDTERIFKTLKSKKTFNLILAYLNIFIFALCEISSQNLNERSTSSPEKGRKPEKR